MELVRVKANEPIDHGYRDEAGEVVHINLETDEVKEIPAEQAKVLHSKGLVKVAAAQAEAIQPESNEQPQTPAPQGEQANG